VLFRSLYELNDAARDFFKKRLENFEPAKKYLTERGLQSETIEEFELGWAPNEAEALGLALINAGYAPQDILEAGLVFKTERGLMTDRFRGRIMFPIHNHFGKTVGFTGRIFPKFENENVGKYLNSPETPIFNKSKLLYGFSKAKNFIREAKSAFLVEGQMDFLMTWQSGVKHVVATSGTALTQDHLRALRRVTEEVVVSFDADEAGWVAGERAIDLAEANDFGTKVAVLDSFKDPAEAAEADPANILKALASAEPAMKFFFKRYLPTKLNAASREDLKNLRIVLGKIKNVASPIQRNFWLQELSKWSGLREQVLAEEAERLQDKTLAADSSDNSPSVFEKRFSRRELISQRLLSMAVLQSNFEFVQELVSHIPPPYDEIFVMLKSGKRSSENPAIDEILNLVILRSETLLPEEMEALKEELRKEYVREKRHTLTEMVRRAEEGGDEARLAAALAELKALSVESAL